MNYAYDRAGNLVYLTTLVQAQNFKSTNQDFYCPECGSKLKLQISSKQKPHFRHQTKQQTKNHESVLHQQGKQQLAQALQQLKIAHRLEATSMNKQRRADVAVFYQNQKYALEWQCAKIGPTEIQQRTRSYQQQGIQVQWFLGPNYRFKGRLTNSQRQFLSYQQPLGFFLMFYDPATHQINLIHHIRQLELTTRVQYQQCRLPVLQGLQLLWGPCDLKIKTVPVNDARTIPDKRKLIYQRLIKQDSRVHQCQIKCYQQGHNLQNLPSSCFEPKSLPPLYPQVDCLLNGLLLLQLELRKSWTYEEIYTIYQSLLSVDFTDTQTQYWVAFSLKAVLNRFCGQKILQHVDQRFLVDHNRLQDW